MITINMNNAALCRLEQQDRSRPAARPVSRATTASAGPVSGRETAPGPKAAPPTPTSVPENARG
ncbi:UNVERIFIED_CONTAM: hypothetical protein RF653_06840 [Kocuria sp. CPCC 205316]|uniref:hypothetical protein n=1 Tax=Kocuria TaxID=57493 RepID=UPI0036DF1295